MLRHFSANNVRTTRFLFLLCSLCSFKACLAADVLKAGQNITGTGTTSFLVSAGKRFVLGFFNPPGSSSESYLGIWYNQEQYPGKQKAVVWVANRDNPVLGSDGVFQIASDGNLLVTNTSRGIHWSSELKGSSSTNRTVKLLDSGNLVLLPDDQNGTSYIWQSFQHPTDTFLPGMKMGTHLNLTCWNKKNDPRSGSYIFMMTANEEGNLYYMIFYIANSSSSLTHWKGGGNLNMGPKFSSVDNMLSNSNKSTYNSPNGCSPYKTIGSQPRKRAILSSDDTRIVMNYTGELQFLQWDGVQSDWIVPWKAPASSCDVYNACGHFTSCNGNSYAASNKTPPCRCLPGFVRVAGGDEGDYECARNSNASSPSSYSCGEGVIRFLSLTVGTVKMGNSDITLPAADEQECRRKCVDMCSSCQAYSYAAPPCATNHDDIIPNDPTNSYDCRIWTDSLGTIQEEYPDGDNDDDGPNLFIRVYKSDIEPTPRTCEPCGTNIVPYPLSTGRNCGDPKYFNFICNNSTGQLRFLPTNAAAGNTSSSDSFIVGSMEVKSRKFVIRIDASDSDCEQAKKMIRPPFNVSTDCIVGNRVEVTWQPPLEPICNKPADCEGWSNSGCKETEGRIKRCLCDSHYHWDNVNLSCTRAGIKGLKAKLLIAGITLTSVVILAGGIIFAYAFRRKITLKKEKKRNQRNREHFHDSVRHVKDLIEVGGLEEEDNEGIEVPYFDFESILVATDNFSDANKLGKGGYGPVHKGKLQSGEVVAVKRLSCVSSQGLQEFKNEVILIAKLQHRNLVRLRGYCIKGNEKILLYEYMHNKSLDSFIFDPTKSQLLNWQMRFDIILGVARGMLYLHHDSRLRVIHRDLKISNILLNEEMQPKISDFGLAKIVEGKETEANTTRVVGTYGYMSPEYALDGLFSTKSDVFSFGVVVLETISGKKNTGFYNSEQFSSLLSFAWVLWTENRLLDLMDMSLGESCNSSQFIRCAHIGLLCVQDEPGDRPTMSNVVTLLDSETSILPTPKQPTFFSNRGQSITTSSSKPEISMQFESSSQEVEYSTMGL